MPEINTMKSSRFLRKEDCGSGILLTIRNCEQMNVAMAGEPEEMKWCLNFVEPINGENKPYVTNSTNREIIAAFSGRSNSDNWGGVKVVLFNNPSVGYGGKLTGGISARAPKLPQGSKPAPVAAPAPSGEDLGEDVPF